MRRRDQFLMLAAAAGAFAAMLPLAVVGVLLDATGSTARYAARLRDEQIERRKKIAHAVRARREAHRLARRLRRGLPI